jgi:hypothetical protein
MMTAEDSNKQYPATIKEEHYTVCAEPGGRYLWHFIPEEATSEKKHAERIADNLVQWLQEKGADKTLLAIGGDSCNVNTGREGGVMHHVEAKLGRKLVWIVCDLHTGELGLRHLVTALDGKTLSGNKWSGPLGKMLDNANELVINANFQRIEIGPSLPNLMVNWFNIKIHSNWPQGANHLLFQLQLLKHQAPLVVDLVLPTMQRSAWYGHSEAVLQAMLCSEEEEERRQAINIIRKVRGEGDVDSQLGDMSVRPRKTPNINANASSLVELIEWKNDVHEPPLTCNLTTTEVMKFTEMPMEVPDWSSHTQSVERCVKMTTEASTHVFSQERRDVYIRGQMVSRDLMSRNRSKKDMFQMINFAVVK